MKLILSVTKRCNMRCPSCLWILEDPDFFKNDDMSVQTAIGIFEHYRKNKKDKLKKIVLQGEGEVFSYPYFKEVYSYFLKSKVAFDGLTTNGLSLDKFLYVAEEINLTISMDGYDSSSYIKHRGGTESMFNKIIENIKKVVALKNRKRVILNCIVPSEDYEKIPKMISFAEYLNVDYLRFGNFHQISGPLTPLFKSDNRVIDCYKGVMKKKNYKMGITLPGLMDRDKRTFKCSQLKGKAIGASGSFSPCCHVPTDIKYGSFPNESEELHNFRRKFAKAKTLDELPTPCQNCPRLFKNRIMFNSETKEWSRDYNSI